ncbi:MAG: hypothetical protein Q7U04_16875 [Bacteriovorax sp.]|nr:hypothetical protein [Bacteriovorax sp.]
MKRIILITFATIFSTMVGLYFRPSYLLVGQLDWLNVLTKGYYVGSFSRFFSQGFLDESFYFVMRFTLGGLGGGFLLTLFAGGIKGSKKSAGKKKK